MTDKQESYTLKMMLGVMEYKPVQYRIVKTIEYRWRWIKKLRYWIETDFCRLGPFDSKPEAMSVLSLGRIPFRDIVDASGEAMAQ